MGRSQSREYAFILVFERQFNPDLSFEEMTQLAQECDLFEADDFTKALYDAALSNIDRVDDEIRKYLRKWRLERLPKVSLAILRLAVAEILFCEDAPPGVVANEAVNLAKKYATKEDASFINGVLGSLIRAMKAEKAADDAGFIDFQVHVQHPPLAAGKPQPRHALRDGHAQLHQQEGLACFGGAGQQHLMTAPQYPADQLLRQLRRAGKAVQPRQVGQAVEIALLLFRLLPVRQADQGAGRGVRVRDVLPGGGLRFRRRFPVLRRVKRPQAHLRRQPARQLCQPDDITPVKIAFHIV